MTDAGPGGEGVFDLDRIRRLVDLMKQHDLARLDLRQGEQRIQLKRATESGTGGTASWAQPSAQEPVPLAASVAVTHGDASGDADYLTFVKSPMVGTFYAKSNPDAEPFVKVGDLVSPDTTVCIVEAMKVFNEIPADVSGRIVAMLVESEEPVEFGKPLFKVDTRG